MEESHNEASRMFQCELGALFLIIAGVAMVLPANEQAPPLARKELLYVCLTTLGARKCEHIS